ncbi:YrzI family small protein [Bacillus spongiae]
MMTLNVLFVSITLQKRTKTFVEESHDQEVMTLYETQKQKQLTYHSLM